MAGALQWKPGDTVWYDDQPAVVVSFKLSAAAPGELTHWLYRVEYPNPEPPGPMERLDRSPFRIRRAWAEGTELTVRDRWSEL